MATQWAVRGEVAALLTGRFDQAWRVEVPCLRERWRSPQRWMRDTTNEQKLFDDRDVAGAAGARAAACLRLRKPSERSFAHPADWAAFSYHGS